VPPVRIISAFGFQSIAGEGPTAVVLVAIIGLRPLRRLLRRRTSERERFVVTGDEELDPAALLSAMSAAPPYERSGWSRTIKRRRFASSPRAG
jgi:hypothetical protein